MEEKGDQEKRGEEKRKRRVKQLKLLRKEKGCDFFFRRPAVRAGRADSNTSLAHMHTSTLSAEHTHLHTSIENFSNLVLKSSFSKRTVNGTFLRYCPLTAEKKRNVVVVEFNFL
eukprot:scaffold2913_cov181-Ochromonas_danica.AAC.31